MAHLLFFSIFARSISHCSLASLASSMVLNFCTPLLLKAGTKALSKFIRASCREAQSISDSSELIFISSMLRYFRRGISGYLLSESGAQGFNICLILEPHSVLFHHDQRIHCCNAYRDVLDFNLLCVQIFIAYRFS
jgi:hypothetical protein